MNRKTALFSLFVSFAVFAHAQDKPVNSGKVIREGIEKYDAEEYEKALSLFQQVPDYDTNGTWAMYEKAMALNSLERYKESYDLLDRLVHEFKYLTPGTYNLWGTVADHMGSSDKAIRIYREGLKLYPMSHLIAFNAGVTFLQNEKIDSGYAYAFRAANINPTHPGSYNTLGIANIKKGRVVPAMLNLIHAILAGLENDASLNSLQTLNNLCTGGTDSELKKAKNGYADFNGANFKEEDYLIISRSALSEKFKKKVKLREPVALQTLLLLDLLKEEHEKIPFYGPLHVAFLRKVKAAELDETLIYVLYAPTGHATINAYIKKNAKKVKQLLEMYYAHVGEFRKKKDLTPYGLPGEHELSYHDNGVVETASANTETPGKGKAMHLYNEEGRLTASGFTQNEKLEGNVNYYHLEGYVEEVRQFKASKATGETKMYYSNGALLGTMNIAANEVTDTTFLNFYYSDGTTLQTTSRKVNGKFEGMSRLYFEDGSPKLTVNYKNNYWNGTRTEYYETGGLKSVEKYTDGIKDGEAVYYYAGGQKSSEGTYKEGKSIGEWKSYFPDGKVLVKSQYDAKGNLSKSEEWDENGTLIEVQELDGSSNPAGTVKLYGVGGKIHSEFAFAGKKVKSCKTYDAQGTATHNETPAGKKFQFFKNDRNYKLFETGLIENEERSGPFITYYNGKDTASLTPYKNGDVEGVVEEFHVTGTLKSTSTYKKDAQDGKFVEYNRNGGPSYQGYYLEGQGQGYWNYYKDNGKIDQVRFFLNGEKHGRFDYFDSYGNMVEMEYYDNGKKTKEIKFDKGVATDTLDLHLGKVDILTHYANQSPKEKYTYLNGIMQGPYVRYYPNGKPMVENTFRNDLAYGTYKSYYPDGKLYAEIPQLQGRYNGKGIYYNESGKLEREVDYVSGDLHGKQVLYYANGKKYRESDFRHDVLDGQRAYFAPDGKLIVTLFFERDYLVGYSYNDPAGNLLPMIALEGGSGKVVAYYPSKSKSCEFNFHKSVFDGKQVAYYPGTDSPIFVENWANFEQDGEQVRYEYGPGRKSAQYTCSKGLKQGMYREYHANGKVQFEADYENDDIKDGEKRFTENGSLSSYLIYVNGILTDVGK